MRSFLTDSILLLAGAAYGQDLAEKIDVTLVNIDVAVLRNHSVHCLTREDGRPQTITNFHAIENAPAAIKAADVVASPAVKQRIEF